MGRHDGTPRYDGSKLAPLLAAQGRRQDWLAAQAGVSQAFLSRLMRGERRASEGVARRIATALQLPLFLAFDRSCESKTDSVEGEEEAA